MDDMMGGLKGKTDSSMQIVCDVSKAAREGQAWIPSFTQAELQFANGSQASGLVTST